MKRRVILLILTLILLLLVIQNASAMASTNYQLEWFTPMTSSSGGVSQSTHYVINFSLGQTVIGNSASTHFGIGLGYWNGIVQWIRLYLPLVLKNN